MQISENSHNVYNHFVDAQGLACPLPLLRMKQALNKAGSGEVLLVKVTDPASERDFKSFIDMTEHTMKMSKENKVFLYWITKN
ncbi:MAG: sulfurtransferase TusA family protein [Kangiellaceae bacterium]|nr:sulfurtransferase TusA family protein [Kangiellaceae bacterium]MCW9000397.1 sulfurtransferase TusA family protein [Kangiellaceae bacterium]